jgi:hypothetical protein
MTIGRIVVWLIVGAPWQGRWNLEKEAERMMKVQ